MRDLSDHQVSFTVVSSAGEDRFFSIERCPFVSCLLFDAGTILALGFPSSSIDWLACGRSSQRARHRQRARRQPGLAAWPGSLAWQPGLATWPGSLAWQPGLADWPRSLAWQPGLAAWPGSLAWQPGLAAWACQPRLAVCPGASQPTRQRGSEAARQRGS